MTFWLTAGDLDALPLPPGDAGTGLTGPPLGVVQGGGPFIFDPFAAYHAGLTTNPNVVVTGSVGAGKSTLVKLLVAQAVREGRRVVIGDPKGEYGALATALGGQVLRLGDDEESSWDPFATPTMAQFDLLVSLATTLRDDGLRDDEWQHLHRAWRAICDAPPPQPLAALVAALGATSLGSLFARCVTGDVSSLWSPRHLSTRDHSLVVLDLSRWWSGPRVAVAALVAMALAEELLVAHGGPGLLVLDEAWALLANPWATQWVAGSWKLARARGVSHVAVLHRASDVAASADAGSAHAARAAGLLADCETTFCFRSSPADLPALQQHFGLSDAECALVGDLPRGVMLARYGPHRSLVAVTPSVADYAFLDTDQALR